MRETPSFDLLKRSSGTVLVRCSCPRLQGDCGLSYLLRRSGTIATGQEEQGVGLRHTETAACSFGVTCSRRLFGTALSLASFARGGRGFDLPGQEDREGPVPRRLVLFVSDGLNIGICIVSCCRLLHLDAQSQGGLFRGAAEGPRRLEVSKSILALTT